MSLPFTDIFIIDLLLTLMYIVGGVILTAIAIFILFAIIYLLLVTSVVWLPILIIVVLICNVFGFGIP